MRFTHSLISISLAALLAGGCGGGGGADSLVPANAGGVTRIVTFGDSLSDPGAYALAAIEKGGGRFTVNGPNARVWTELVANDYGLPLRPNQVVTDIGPQINPTGTSYAEGGSRTNPRSTSPLETLGINAFPNASLVKGILINPLADGTCPPSVQGVPVTASRFGSNPNNPVTQNDTSPNPPPGNAANYSGCIVAVEDATQAAVLSATSDSMAAAAARAALSDDAGNGFFVSNSAGSAIGLGTATSDYARTGLTTRPISKQVASFLTANPSGDGNTLITYLGGANDLLILVGAFAASGGALTLDNAKGISAQLAVQVANQLKSLQQAGYSKILVANVPDLSLTPAFQGTPVADAANQITAAFNMQLADCLSATPMSCADIRTMPATVIAASSGFTFDSSKVKLFDTSTLFQQLVTDITAVTKTYGISALGPVCNPAGFPSSTKYSLKTTTSSLLCNSNDLVSGAKPDETIFADGVHPTPKIHALFSQQVVAKLREFGWR